MPALSRSVHTQRPCPQAPGSASFAAHSSVTPSFSLSGCNGAGPKEEKCKSSLFLSHPKFLADTHLGRVLPPLSSEKQAIESASRRNFNPPVAIPGLLLGAEEAETQVMGKIGVGV